MKNIKSKFNHLPGRTFMIILLWIPVIGHSQDLLVTTAGDSVNCKILNVATDTIRLMTEVRGKMVNTQLPMSKVKNIAPGYYTRSESDTTEYYQIETIDGNIYMGQILSQDGELIRIRTVNIGDITINTSNIESMKRVGSDLARSVGSRWFDYLQSSRYFYGPSGYGLKKGDAYYQNVWILFNQFTIGFTDHISMGIGTVPLFFFGGTPTPVWITPKLSIPIVEGKFNIGAGALLGSVIGAGENFGILYGIGTVGSRDKNLSLGVGYGYAVGEFTQKPSVSISGMLPVGRRSYLITENYIIDELALLSIGGRSLIKRITLDYGLFFPTEAGSFVAVPWLGIVIPVETGL